MTETGNGGRDRQTFVVSAARTPIGKFGGAFVETPAGKLERRQAQYGLATQCLGGGGSMAMAFERA
jgi:acetyl-CoA acetyltransferase